MVTKKNVNVTQRDIDKAIALVVEQQKNPNPDFMYSENCPIALACRRIFKGYRIGVGSYVGVHYIAKSGYEATDWWFLPAEAKQLIENFDLRYRDFDTAREIHPLRFTITLEPS